MAATVRQLISCMREYVGIHLKAKSLSIPWVIGGDWRFKYLGETWKIASRCNGGDNAPQAAVENCVNQAIRDFDDIENCDLYVTGQKSKNLFNRNRTMYRLCIRKKNRFRWWALAGHSSEKQASMVLGAKEMWRLVSRCHAICRKYRCAIGRLVSLLLGASGRGTSRLIVTTLPTVIGRGYDMLNLGANGGKAAEHLHRYAVMNRLLCWKCSWDSKITRGSIEQWDEASKGKSFAQETYNCYLRISRFILLETWKRARDLMDGVADVVVADGFTEAFVLKTMEGTAFGILKQVKQAIATELEGEIGSISAWDRLKSHWSKPWISQMFEASCFGLPSTCLLKLLWISSDAKTVYSTIRQIRDTC